LRLSRVVTLLLGGVFLLVVGCSEPDQNSDQSQQKPATLFADQVFTGGSVITMDVSKPEAEAVAVTGGKIIAVGSAEEVGTLIGDQTEIIDLSGQTLMPGFIDAHSHFSHAAGAASWANVSGAPVGDMATIADVLAEMQALKQRHSVAAGEWLIGYGYDADTLAEGRHITRDDLDRVLPDNPVLLIHVSFHGGVLNSKAFSAINYDENTPTPAGGVIVRRENSNEPLGLLMETAWFPAIASLPRPAGESRFTNINKTQQHYAANGVTIGVFVDSF
jgi:predicted amidohydrolase YtcJ